MTGWHSIMERLQQCHLPNLPRGVPDLRSEPERDTATKKRTANHTDVLEHTRTQFFCSHVLHVRNFVRQHPTHNLIELDLYDEATPTILDRLFPSQSSPPSSLSMHDTEVLHNSASNTASNKTAADGILLLLARAGSIAIYSCDNESSRKASNS